MPLPTLDANSIVCRLARRRDWINPDDPNRFLPEAFYCRDDEIDGLSVNYGEGCKVEFIKAMKKAAKPLTAHGSAEILVGTIRTLNSFGLDVEPDTSTHANISRVPLKKSDPKRARDIAHALAQEAIVTWRRVPVTSD